MRPGLAYELTGAFTLPATAYTDTTPDASASRTRLPYPKILGDFHAADADECRHLHPPPERTGMNQRLDERIRRTAVILILAEILILLPPALVGGAARIFAPREIIDVELYFRRGGMEADAIEVDNGSRSAVGDIQCTSSARDVELGPDEPRVDIFRCRAEVASGTLLNDIVENLPAAWQKNHVPGFQSFRSTPSGGVFGLSELLVGCATLLAGLALTRRHDWRRDIHRLARVFHDRRVLAVPAVLACIWSSSALLVFAGWLPNDLAFARPSSSAEWAMLGILAIVIAPLGEELLVRGWLIDRLSDVWPRAASVVASSLVFALAHASARVGDHALGFFLQYAITGCLLGVVRTRLGSLALCIFLHCLVNGLAMAALFFHPARCGPAPARRRRFPAPTAAPAAPRPRAGCRCRRRRRGAWAWRRGRLRPAR